MKKDDLVIPTDAAALLFGVLIFSVAIFALNRRFLVDPDTYWHIATGNWIMRFPGMIFFLILQPVSLG